MVLDGVECAGAQVYVLIDNKVGGMVVVGVTTTSPEEMELVLRRPVGLEVEVTIETPNMKQCWWTGWGCKLMRPR